MTRVNKSRLSTIGSAVAVKGLAALLLAAIACHNAGESKRAENAGPPNINRTQPVVNRASDINANNSNEPGLAATDDFEGTAGITEKKSSTGGVVTLMEVRTARHEKFDRVVFEFAESYLPGYRIEYVDKPVRSCGSGEAVALEGDGYLLVRFQPASAHTEAGEPTVKERERRPALSVLKELKLICDFEAEVSWAMGLASPNRYRAIELSSPTRLVVDIKH
jgi:hypothetical protein